MKDGAGPDRRPPEKSSMRAWQKMLAARPPARRRRLATARLAAPRLARDLH